MTRIALGSLSFIIMSAKDFLIFSTVTNFCIPGTFDARIRQTSMNPIFAVPTNNEKIPSNNNPIILIIRIE
jgi:hypothetical protein